MKIFTNFFPKRNENGTNSGRYTKGLRKTIKDNLRFAQAIERDYASPEDRPAINMFGNINDISEQIKRLKKSWGEFKSVTRKDLDTEFTDHNHNIIEGLKDTTITLAITHPEKTQDNDEKETDVVFYDISALNKLLDHGVKHKKITQKEQDIIAPLIDIVNPEKKEAYLPEEVGTIIDLARLIIVFLNRKVFGGDAAYLDMDIAEAMSDRSNGLLPLEPITNKFIDSAKTLPSKPGTLSLTDNMNSLFAIEGITDDNKIFLAIKDYYKNLIQKDNKPQTQSERRTRTKYLFKLVHGIDDVRPRRLAPFRGQYQPLMDKLEEIDTKVKPQNAPEGNHVPAETWNSGTTTGDTDSEDDSDCEI